MPDAKHALVPSLPRSCLRLRLRFPLLLRQPKLDIASLHINPVGDSVSHRFGTAAHNPHPTEHPHIHTSTHPPSPGLFHAISLKSADASPCCAAAAAVAFLPCPAPIHCVSRLGSAKNVTTQPCCIDGSHGHFHFHFHSGVPTSTSVPALVSISHPLLYIHRLFQPSILEPV
ncbi:hypothetical protein BGZ61DRAFT_477556 [Ilyonectria robusta]|uniref:uncharacterized protein n=1 Tax=Ilyonectria robusta TaxID=1079257 RepID=UPI001E8D19B4|nr:uncharacterized protein BGZ61DRAFT_477556 [Ilyonectria robusta]KAH8699562.1 hypothetical protein BGZ61DRAFT_477556 [Ilyonectria robusta]